MKKYKTIGDLLKDYRIFSKLTQGELSAKFDVDIRTILRWEKNMTLLKPDKEEAMVDITFIPYQVIRNLNAPVAIPTFYDFRFRKYSVSEFSKELPDMNWLKSKDDLTTERLRSIKFDVDIDNILRCYETQMNESKLIDKAIIFEATKLLPELNFILFDSSGYYAGHSVFFPLKRTSYDKLKSRILKEDDITLDDFANYKDEETPVFYAYDVNSDCNENLFYIASAIRSFFTGIHSSFTYASFTHRDDTYLLNQQLGSSLLWEEDHQSDQSDKKLISRFYELNIDRLKG